MRRRPQKLRQKLESVHYKKNQILSRAETNLDRIAAESHRVADLMRNTGNVLENLDLEFEECCKITKTDITFLFLTVALQCARQYIFTNDAFRLTAEEGDRLMKNIVPKDWHDVLLASVPYDAIRTSSTLIDSTGLSGATHRYRTLGHDPIFGWLFGPINIISDSLTKTDFITTYSVKNMCIENFYHGGTIGAFSDSMNAIQAEKMLLPVAVLRQALHFGSDYFTKQGLPLPIISSINNDFAKSLISQYSIDMYSVTRGAALSICLNTIISYIHTLFYNPSVDGSRDIYEVRTRRIVTYGNIIASSSNIIYVAVQNFIGNTTALKSLDVGGLLVTLYRLVTDKKYISQLKMEFLSNRFYDLVMDSSIK